MVWSTKSAAVFLACLLLPVVTVFAAEKKGANKTDKSVTKTTAAPAALGYETGVGFRNFPWGTSMNEVIKTMGKPVSQEEFNGLTSLAWEKINAHGYTSFMLAYFSKSGLQGGTYYFLTNDLDELMKCYSDIRQELRGRYGPTKLFEGIIKEARPYECSWHLPGGLVYLKVNTRANEPVTLWYSSPELTSRLFGDTPEPVTAEKSNSRINARPH